MNLKHAAERAGLLVALDDAPHGLEAIDDARKSKIVAAVLRRSDGRGDGDGPGGLASTAR